MFKLAVLQADGSEDSGSATLFETGKLVTNCHVTRSARRIEVLTASARMPVEQYAADPTHDICLLSAPGLDAPEKQSSAASTLRVGQTVYAIGYPGGSAQHVSRGEVLALHDYERSKVVRTDAAFEPGESGGGLFDRDGRLVGVLAFKAAQGGAFHFALPIEWLSEVSQGATANSAERAFWERPRQQQPAFLRAAALESARDWSGLLEFGRRWAAQESTNPDAWMARAKGAHHHRRGLAEEAAFAYRQAANLSNKPEPEQLVGLQRGYACAQAACLVALPAQTEEPASQDSVGEN